MTTARDAAAARAWAGVCAIGRGVGVGEGAGATTAARTGEEGESSRELVFAAPSMIAEHVPQKNSEPKIIASSAPAVRLLFGDGAAQLGVGGGPYSCGA